MFGSFGFFSAAPQREALPVVSLEDIRTYPASAWCKARPAGAEGTSEFHQGIAERISVFKGDITRLRVDSIVNAANERCLGGSGVDGAIHKAAGRALAEHIRATFPVIAGRGYGCRCPTGSVITTGGFKIDHIKHILHTVGPQGEQPDVLKKCYRVCLDEALAQGDRSIAFCCISTGVYGYPAAAAARVAVATVRDWFLEEPERLQHLDRVVFCCFLPSDVVHYRHTLQSLIPCERAADAAEQEEEEGDAEAAKQEEGNAEGPVHLPPMGRQVTVTGSGAAEGGGIPMGRQVTITGKANAVVGSPAVVAGDVPRAREVSAHDAEIPDSPTVAAPAVAPGPSGGPATVAGNSAPTPAPGPGAGVPLARVVSATDAELPSERSAAPQSAVGSAGIPMGRQVTVTGSGATEGGGIPMGRQVTITGKANAVVGSPDVVAGDVPRAREVSAHDAEIPDSPTVAAPAVAPGPSGGPASVAGNSAPTPAPGPGAGVPLARVVSATDAELPSERSAAPQSAVGSAGIPMGRQVTVTGSGAAEGGGIPMGRQVTITGKANAVVGSPAVVAGDVPRAREVSAHDAEIPDSPTVAPAAVAAAGEAQAPPAGDKVDDAAGQLAASATLAVSATAEAAAAEAAAAAETEAVAGTAAAPAANRRRLED